MRRACSCGEGDREACRLMHHAVIVRETENFAFSRLRRLRVDAYCMQHPDEFMVSVKSFVAHFLGLCIAIEHGNEPRLFNALRRWNYGLNKVAKPELPTSFGPLTIAHVMDAKDDEEYVVRLHEWGRSVWEAYAPLHGLAGEWLDSLMAERAWL